MAAQGWPTGGSGRLCPRAVQVEHLEATEDRGPDVLRWPYSYSAGPGVALGDVGEVESAAGFFRATNAEAASSLSIPPMTLAFHPETGGHGTPSSASCAFVQPPAADLPNTRSSSVIGGMSSPRVETMRRFQAWFQAHFQGWCPLSKKTPQKLALVAISAGALEVVALQGFEPRTCGL